MQNEIYFKKKIFLEAKYKKINQNFCHKNYSTFQVPTDLGYIFIYIL